MNQHLFWPFTRTVCVFRVFNKTAKLLNVSFSVLAPVDRASIRRFHVPARTMLEIDEVGLGLAEINCSQFGQRATKFKPPKYRKITSDYTQQGIVHRFLENDNESKLIKDWIANLKQSKCHYGEAVFVLGPMGAGKTTVLSEEFKKHSIYKDYAYVDTDELMEKLDGFNSDKVEEFYPTARSIAIKLTDWLLNEKISFVAEGTCVKYLELEDYMVRLKNKGYVIRVKHVNDIPLEEILKRTSKRKRKVPEDVVESIYYGSLKGVKELKKLNVNNNLFGEL